MIFILVLFILMSMIVTTYISCMIDIRKELYTSGCKSDSIIIPKECIHVNKTSNVCFAMVSINDPRGYFSAQLWQDYCKRWSYDFVVLEKEIIDSNTYDMTWAKIPFCFSLFHHYDYRYIVHVDADSYPLKTHVSFEQVLSSVPMQPESSFWVGKEPSYAGRSDLPFPAINCGVFVCKNNAFMKDFLENVWAKRAVTAKKTFHEQTAIESVMTDLWTRNRQEFEKQIVIVDYDVLQTFMFKQPDDVCQIEDESTLNTNIAQDCKTDAWIMHFPSRRHDVTIHHMQKTLQGTADHSAI